MPDQYILSAFQRLELAKPDRAPVMAEIDLVSSHTPWAPLPHMVDWDEVGDGSVFDGMPAQGQSPKRRVARPRPGAGGLRAVDRVLAEHADLVRADLRATTTSCWSCSATTSRPRSSAATAPSHDVPITIIAHDPAVLDRIAGWGWQDGLRPGPDAPVWPMDAFRDRFLTAYGPQPAASQAQP